MREASLELVRDLSLGLGNRRLSRPSINFDGSAIALAMPPGPPTTRVFGPGATKDCYPEDVYGPRLPYTCDVLVWRDDHVTETGVSAASVFRPFLQEFADGRILIAGLSTSREVSGFVYDESGELADSVNLGYGQEHVFVTADNHIWAAYFDEAMGDMLGHLGLVQFDERGNKLWGFNDNPGSAPPIYDCYALNVGSQAIWFSAVDGFGLTRVIEGKVGHWTHPVVGAVALAVDGSSALLFGGYADERSSCRLANFGSSELENIEDVVLRLPDGRVLDELEAPIGDETPAYWVVGRDDALHVFAEERWYRLRVSDVLNS